MEQCCSFIKWNSADAGSTDGDAARGGGAIETRRTPSDARTAPTSSTTST
ncbi:hypothetical protein ACFQDG_17575 [Natronoarchaeum mannanilyticum]